jgi:hypothetical protein
MMFFLDTMQFPRLDVAIWIKATNKLSVIVGIFMKPSCYFSSQEANMYKFSKRTLFRTRHIMFKQSICIACAILFVAALTCAQESPEGHWEGSAPEDFDINRPIGISLDLAKNANSEWVASMGVPALNATGLVVQSV